jgi:hypothetical protein
VKIVAADMVWIDGAIAANGTNYLTQLGGGGSGGGVSIVCRSLGGIGTISADGGKGAPTQGGGGGGGRIALIVREAPYYTAGNVLYTPTAGGGTGYSNGVPGTIYRELGKSRGTMFCSW